MIDLMLFKDFDEFITRKKAIQVYYIFLTYEQKRAYKKFIYSLPYKESVKDVIWSYINEPTDEYCYDFELSDIERLYARNKDSIRI